LEAKHEQEKLMIIQNGEQSAQQRLSELEDRLHQSHQADLTVQAEQLQKQFDQRVQQLVDEERQGRLARLELLSAKLDLLERLTRSYVEAYGQASRLHRVWTAYFLARGAVESNDPQQLRSLRRHWTLLQELGKDEPLIETVLASIQSAVLDQGVPAMSELRAQFESLEGKLHQVGLAPEDGGLFELSIAYLFSLLRFRNVDSGGNDVESIVTRTKYYLKNGDLSSATREMNSLDGWSRRLARDFLERCRRRLEVQQALDAVEAHLGQQTLSTAALLSPATSS
jgi:mitofilin